uniref:Uncharacterized protein n=1 Tax=Anopheles farauti TaxID=69004 RepID=A0A182Q2X5_9DIPT
MAATSEVTSCGPGRPPPPPSGGGGGRNAPGRRGSVCRSRWMQLGTVWVTLLLALMTVGHLGSVHGEKTKTCKSSGFREELEALECPSGVSSSALTRGTSTSMDYAMSLLEVSIQTNAETSPQPVGKTGRVCKR